MDERDAAILEAAARRFAEGGIAAVTIRAVGEDSGASTGSIYHRFGDRAGILAALCLGAFARATAALREVLEGDPPAERGLPALVLAWVDWVLAEPLQARMIYEITVSPDLDPRREAMNAEKAPLFAPIYAWVASEVRAGRLRPLPDWAWDPVVFGPAHELCRRWLADRRLPLVEARQEIAETVWRAVAPDRLRSA